MLQAELKILGGKHQGKSIPLSTKKFLVGREQDCHLRPNSDMVSRHHCVFLIDDYSVRLRDLGSTNGTRVNGEALRGETMLKSGDHIGIGKMELELVVRQVASVQAPAKVTGNSGDSSVIHSDSAILNVAAASDSSLEVSNATISETSFEMPAAVSAVSADTTTGFVNDTAIVVGTPVAPIGAPGVIPAMVPGYPGMVPQGYAMMPGYPQAPVPYPPQYQQYPPGFGQPGYPAMAPYPMGMPAVPGYAPAGTVEPERPKAVAEPAVRLPPPETTGYKPPPSAAPAPVSTAEGTAPKAAEEKPSNTAADIIKQYMQKRNR